jgi:nucleotide-binding universal stress UspA family protein
MSTPYKILIAVAFDRTAEPALRDGIGLAIGHPDAELHIVHVTREPRSLDTVHTLMPTADGPEEPSVTLRRYVEDAWKQTAEVKAIAHIRSGNAPEVILQAAIDIGADIVVVGSHRKSGLKKLVLGSVAEQVFHASHCPVLIAISKDYTGTVATPTVEPPCQDCLATRKASANARFWCERHSKPYLEPHIYVPREQARSSVFPTY